ncbi:tryptophan halogenase family protein [Sandarakinorhabdus cyanobacteriorum]|uniref:tryptophan halogenase family protein n=1 Tax=Sandarakinorhabdus cyanobacteriorum TaxID=1981098 RepID=UPI001FAF2A56|nr:tryptophan halogenase family protein [Sandarakinorhabdus cyanobacteriorum]
MTEDGAFRIVIAGGGTAGWLTACVLAARHPQLDITLVESPDIPTIGVGEGTWPTMRETLASIGRGEAEFMAACDASFKQGSRFDGWVTGAEDDICLHPFTLPPPGNMAALLHAWASTAPARRFAEVMTAQAAACAQDLAPRQRGMPDYAGALNYGYHFDAGKFAKLLTRHATGRLGVKHVPAEIVGTIAADNGDVAALVLADGRQLAADLFIDCTGQAARLIAGHCGVAWIDRSHVSFNDRALAVQGPVAQGSPIASQTIGTAHRAGWIWDIDLPTRRGIGCVYASRFMSDDEAHAVLCAHVAAKVPGADVTALAPRRLAFATGHRARFWQGNVVAVGLSAGFIEPLEASAIVLIELSARALADALPASRAAMDIHARRFDDMFHTRWDRIVDFLKLHYVLSRQSEPYWQAQRDPASLSPRLAEDLVLWREQPPSARDFPLHDEMFPPASQHYILYGMGHALPPAPPAPAIAAAAARLAEVQARSRQLGAALPENRIYLAAGAAQAACGPHASWPIIRS